MQQRYVYTRDVYSHSQSVFCCPGNEAKKSRKITPKTCVHKKDMASDPPEFKRDSLFEGEGNRMT